MRRFILLFFILLSLTLDISAEDNVFNDYLLHNQDFNLTYSSAPVSLTTGQSIFSDKNYKSTNDKFKKYIDFEKNSSSPNVTFSITPQSSLSLSLKDDQTEIIPIDKRSDSIQSKGYNFNLHQYWGYNIVSNFSYFYTQNNLKYKDNAFSEKGYNFNFTKLFAHGDKFDLSYRYYTASPDSKENFYLIESDKNQDISLSYEILFSNKLSLVMLYSVDKGTFGGNYIYTGFKYTFDSEITSTH